MSPPGITAGAAARRLGVAVTTLRTWHQRYGLGPTLHEPGQHRRYAEEDLARLELMQRLVAEGVPPGDAARWVLRQPAGAGRGGETRRDGGGLALGDAEPAARGLSRVAVRLDAAAMREQLTAAITDRGVVNAWETVICPVLVAIGDRHATSGKFVEVEHLLSGCVLAALTAVPRPDRAAPSRILLACAEEEQHTLALEALAAALAEARVPCRMLGARLPTSALLAAVRRTGPAAVTVWSQQVSTADPTPLAAILGERARPLLIAAAGPGWRTETLPSGVATPASLGAAVTALTAAVA